MYPMTSTQDNNLSFSNKSNNPNLHLLAAIPTPSSRFPPPSSVPDLNPITHQKPESATTSWTSESATPTTLIQSDVNTNSNTDTINNSFQNTHHSSITLPPPSHQMNQPLPTQSSPFSQFENMNSHQASLNISQPTFNKSNTNLPTIDTHRKHIYSPQNQPPHLGTNSYSTGNVTLPAPIPKNQHNTSISSSSHPENDQNHPPSLPSSEDNKIDSNTILDQNPGLSASTLTLGKPPQGVTPKITTTLWEDEGTLCFQVEVKGVCIARREDNNMVNGTKLLNIAGMSRGRRDGILKAEKKRHVVKIGAMHFKGVWIPYERAVTFAFREKIIDKLYPLFISDIKSLLYHSTNYARTALIMSAAIRKKKENQQKQQERQEMIRKKQEEQQVAQLQKQAQFARITMTPTPPHYYNPYIPGGMIPMDPYQRQPPIPQPGYMFPGPPPNIVPNMSPNQQPQQPSYQPQPHVSQLSPSTPYPNYYYHPNGPQPPQQQLPTQSQLPTPTSSHPDTAGASQFGQLMQMSPQVTHLPSAPMIAKPSLPLTSSQTYTIDHSQQVDLRTTTHPGTSSNNNLKLPSPNPSNNESNSNKVSTNGQAASLYQIQCVPAGSAAPSPQSFMSPVGTTPVNMGTSPFNIQQNTTAVIPMTGSTTVSATPPPNRS